MSEFPTDEAVDFTAMKMYGLVRLASIQSEYIEPWSAQDESEREQWRDKARALLAAAYSIDELLVHMNDQEDSFAKWLSDLSTRNDLKHQIVKALRGYAMKNDFEESVAVGIDAAADYIEHQFRMKSYDI